MPKKDAPRLSGGSNPGYYQVYVEHPTNLPEPYYAECNDLIEALGMTFAEGEAFKAIWRRAQARQGNGKPGSTVLYESEKAHFFTERLLVKAES